MPSRAVRAPHLFEAQTIAVCDYVAIAVLLVSPRGRIVRCNRAARALLEKRDGLESIRSRLRAVDRSADDELTHAIQSVRDGAADTWQVVHVPHGSGKTTFAVCVAPIGNDGRPRLAALYVLDSWKPVDLAPGLLQVLYGFSPGEARVAAALVRFGGPGQIASALSLSVHTVRTHLKSILAKTGVRRQSEVVRILVRGAGALNCEALGNTLFGRCVRERHRVHSPLSNSSNQETVE